MVDSIVNDLKKLSSREKSKIYSRFFKTGKGEYGEGDKFLGITVPDVRKIAKRYYEISSKELEKLLSSGFHEERLCALLVLVHKFEKGDEKEKKTIYDFYLDNTNYINNWDLVDLSSYKIVGKYLFEANKDCGVLIKLSKSENLWEKRIGMISTYYFIKNDVFGPTLEVSDIL